MRMLGFPETQFWAGAGTVGGGKGLQQFGVCSYFLNSSHCPTLLNSQAVLYTTVLEECNTLLASKVSSSIFHTCFACI